MLQEIIDFLQTNSVMAMLFGGGAIVTFFVYLKEILLGIVRAVHACIAFSICCRYDCTFYTPMSLVKFLHLIDTKGKVIWARKCELVGSEENSARIVPHGDGLYWLYGKIVFVRKDFESNAKSLSTNITMRVYFANKAIFSKMLMDDLSKMVMRANEDGVTIRTLHHEVVRKKRKMDSIYSSNNVGEKVLDDVRRFLANESLYRECSIPYKRNYLFYGKPGTGKTSVAFALASELNMDVQIIDVGHDSTDTVMTKMTRSQNSIFLFEDIDAASKPATAKRESASDDDDDDDEEDNNKLSLAQLLNFTDGLCSREGIICIFTTNHIEKLDPAFLRDGRMDVKIEFKDLDAKSAAAMVARLACKQVEGCVDGLSPASLQEKILQHRLGKISDEELTDFCRGGNKEGRN